MLPTHEQLNQLAGRIESAYGLRRSRWRVECSTSRLWDRAALRLWEAHALDPARIPLDAELFVAAQPRSDCLSDPWTEIAHVDASKRYRAAVIQIIRQLRSELKREVHGAERAIRTGREIGSILNDEQFALSPLGAYILARRARRDDLAELFVIEAAAQHRSCPLYRAATSSICPAEYYPEENPVVSTTNVFPQHVRGTIFSSRRLYRECPN